MEPLKLHSTQECWKNGKKKELMLPNNEEKYACWQLQLISLEHQDYEWYKMH